MSANGYEGRRKHPQASEDVLLRLSPVIRKASERYAVDGDHADDLVQDCLVHIAVKLQRCRAEDIESIEAWAWKVTHNLCESIRRAAPAIHGACDDRCEIPDSGPLPDHLLERKLRRAAVRAAVRKLPRSQRDAIELVYLQGLSHKTAASRLGVRVNALRASVYRAIHNLRGMRDLAVWQESFHKNAMCGIRNLDDGQHPVLALESETWARDRIRAGICYGEIDRLLDGVYFATGWDDLYEMARRAPGCPVVVDPCFPTARRSGIEELRVLRARLPTCPIIGHGHARGAWCRASVRHEIGFVAILRRGLDDDREAVRLAALRATDCDETERLLDRIRKCVPRSMHHLLDATLHESLTRSSVARLAEKLGLTPRTLARNCRTHRLPTPKRLLSLAVIFHVERLARWSGHKRGPTALALGFSDAANYARLAKRTLGATPTEIARRGGPDFVALMMLRELRCGGADAANRRSKNSAA